MRGAFGVVALLTSLLALSGCAASTQRGAASVAMPQQYDRGRVDADGDGDRANLAGYNDINNPPVHVTTPSSANGDITQGRTAGVGLAESIASLSQAAHGVAAASAVVSGRSALIGLDLQPNIRRADPKPIIADVRKRVLIHAPGLTNVHITTDRALASRIDHIRLDLKSGRPLASYDADLRQLFSRIPAAPPYDSGHDKTS